MRSSLRKRSIAGAVLVGLAAIAVPVVNAYADIVPLDTEPYEEYLPGVPPEKPAFGQVVYDATFGTPVMRVTDGGGNHAYS